MEGDEGDGGEKSRRIQGMAGAGKVYLKLRDPAEELLDLRKNR